MTAASGDRAARHSLLAARYPLPPSSATADARRLLIARALRGFADGIVSVLLAS